MEDVNLDPLVEQGQVETISADLIPSSPALDIQQPDATPASYPVIVQGAVDCWPAETAMITAAYVDLNKVVSSQLFKDQVLAAQFTETNTMSNAAIYDLMVARSPIAVDFVMFAGKFFKNVFSKTMGYEDPNRPNACFANRHFIKSKEVCASLILHETMHILGFKHLAVKATSVPYTMNNIYDTVARALGLEV